MFSYHSLLTHRPKGDLWHPVALLQTTTLFRRSQYLIRQNPPNDSIHRPDKEREYYSPVLPPLVQRRCPPLAISGILLHLCCIWFLLHMMILIIFDITGRHRAMTEIAGVSSFIKDMQFPIRLRQTKKQSAIPACCGSRIPPTVLPFLKVLHQTTASE